MSELRHTKVGSVKNLSLEKIGRAQFLFKILHHRKRLRFSMNTTFVLEDSLLDNDVVVQYFLSRYQGLLNFYIKRHTARNFRKRYQASYVVNEMCQRIFFYRFISCRHFISSRQNITHCLHSHVPQFFYNLAEPLIIPRIF